MSFKVSNISKQKEIEKEIKIENKIKEDELDISSISKRIDEIQNKLKLETSLVKPELDSIVYDPALHRWKLKKGG